MQKQKKGFVLGFYISLDSRIDPIKNAAANALVDSAKID